MSDRLLGKHLLRGSKAGSESGFSEPQRIRDD